MSSRIGQILGGACPECVEEAQHVNLQLVVGAGLFGLEFAMASSWGTLTYRPEAIPQ